MERVSVHKAKPAPSAANSASSWFASTQRSGVLQRRSDGQSQPASVPPIVHDVLNSPGQPLDAATRADMEPRFGHDFSKVRVHADAQAAESARAVSALAYAVGEHVAFRGERYAPGTSAGRHLLAHELAHVVQQARGGSGSVSDAEARADAAAAGIIRGQSVAPEVVGGAAPGLYRQSSAEEESEGPWHKALRSSQRSGFGSSLKDPLHLDPPSPLAAPPKRPLFLPGSSPSWQPPQPKMNMLRQGSQHEHELNLDLNPNKGGGTGSGFAKMLKRVSNAKVGAGQLDILDFSDPPKSAEKKAEGVDKFKINALGDVKNSTIFGGIGIDASIDWLLKKLLNR